MDDKPFDLPRVLAEWKKDYGTLTRSKKWSSEYYLIPISDRFELLKMLIQRIRDDGKGEEYFNNSTKDVIVESCIPHEKSVTPESYKMFKKGTQEHLRMAIIEIYSETTAEKTIREHGFTKEFDPKSIVFPADEPVFADTVDPEMAKLLGEDE